MKNNNTLVVILSVLLVLALSYIVVGQYEEAKTQEQITIFQQGAQAGYEQAIVTLMQQMSTCEPVPLFAGNISMNAIAVECLQGAQ